MTALLIRYRHVVWSTAVQRGTRNRTAVLVSDGRGERA
jgi:hypothetical protein